MSNMDIKKKLLGGIMQAYMEFCSSRNFSAFLPLCIVFSAYAIWVMYIIIKEFKNVKTLNEKIQGVLIFIAHLFIIVMGIWLVFLDYTNWHFVYHYD